MLKRILYFFTWLIIAMHCICAFAAADVTNHPQRGRSVRLTPEQLKVISRVSAGKPSTPRYAKLNPTLNQNSLAKQHPMRVSASGATIQGMKVDVFSNEETWCEVATDGHITDLWSIPSTFFNAAFIRDGKIYGFSSSMMMGYAFLSHGIYDLEGHLIKWWDNDDFEDFSTYVIQLAYDSSEDLAYAYTLNSDASGYMFCSIDPQTFAFSIINDNVAYEDICCAMTWCADDGNLYGVTADRKFSRINRQTGSIEELKKIKGFEVSSAGQGLVYSPYDKMFFYALYGKEWDSTLLRIDPVTWEYDEVASLGYTFFPILDCADPAIDGNAPKTPTIIDISFEKASLSGNCTVILPVENFNGSSIQGRLKLTIEEEETPLVVYTDCSPAETRKIDLNLEEGLHNLYFYVENEEGLKSPKVQRKTYTGYDTPATPKNVKLEEGLISWDAVSTGNNGGYIDFNNLCYNVYLDGCLLNSVQNATQYEFSMPEREFGMSTAAVEAVNGTRISDKGCSNAMAFGGGLNLPYILTPTEEEMQLLTILDLDDDGYGWEKWIKYDGAIECSTFNYKPSDDWMILPPLQFKASDYLYEVSFDVMSGDNSAHDILEIAHGLTIEPAEMEVFDVFDSFSDEKDGYKRKTSFLYIKNDADLRIGFHAATPGEGGGLYLKNITVYATDISSSTPRQPEIVSITAASEGELKATLEFIMPTEDCSGNLLESSRIMEAEVRCDNKSYILTGLPGETLTQAVETSQGFNTISVAVKANNSSSLSSEVKVFTGYDMPKAVEKMIVEMDADNATLLLQWEEPTEGIHGGYVKPGSQVYYFCQEDEYGDWEVSLELGNRNSCELTLPTDLPLQTMYFGLAVGDGTEINPQITIDRAMVGTPLKLPIKETFADYSLDTPPVFELQPTEEYTAIWNECDNYWAPVEKDGQGQSCCADWRTERSKGLLMLPKFSTINSHGAVVDLNVLVYPDMGRLNVLGYSPLKGLIEIGSIDKTASSESIWKEFRFIIPEEFIGQPWITILLETEFDSSDQVFYLDSYDIRITHDSDVEVIKAQVTPFAKVGEPLNFEYEIMNIGSRPFSLPESFVSLKGDTDEVVRILLEPTEDISELPIFGKIGYLGVQSATADMIGLNAANFNFANSTLPQAYREIRVYKDRLPVVTDLSASKDGNEIKLEWSDPMPETGIETFENIASWCFADTFGEFLNVDLDLGEGLYFQYFDFPYDRAVKGFQIISESEFGALLHEAFPDDENFMKAYQGDKFACSIRPFGGEADNWLVSPVLNGGSKFSFQAAIVAGYISKMEVLFSSTDNTPESFELFESYDLISDGWKPFEITLPSDVKYVAIRHIGDGFGLCIDDIHYSSVDNHEAITGYQILRDGKTIASTTTPFTYFVDVYEASKEKIISYQVRPLFGTTEGQKSNTAIIGTSGINSVDNDNIRILTNKESITLLGCKDTSVNIFDSLGIRVFSETGLSGEKTITLTHGIYLIEIDGRAVKVII
ncbi:MAG: hypothetical protein HDR98_07665 [Bacteroides sp.]|nr:hypothetical protein [Bacteroides sp.]MBD5338980.1 hypothetical protein [Bacteroides sp.]